jgi:hypothetical protein
MVTVSVSEYDPANSGLVDVSGVIVTVVADADAAPTANAPVTLAPGPETTFVSRTTAVLPGPVTLAEYSILLRKPSADVSIAFSSALPSVDAPFNEVNLTVDPLLHVTLNVGEGGEPVVRPVVVLVGINAVVFAAPEIAQKPSTDAVIVMSWLAVCAIALEDMAATAAAAIKNFFMTYLSCLTSLTFEICPGSGHSWLGAGHPKAARGIHRAKLCWSRSTPVECVEI